MSVQDQLLARDWSSFDYKTFEITQLRLCIIARVILLLLLLIRLVLVPLPLFHCIRWTVCYELTVVIDACPLWLSVINVKYPPWVKHMARWFEILFVRIIFEVDQSWEQQNHISPFIHNWRSTIGAADFAGQLVYTCLVR